MLSRVGFSSRGSTQSAEQLNEFLAERGTAPLTGGAPLIALLRRPQIHYEDLRRFDPLMPDLPGEVTEQVEISVILLSRVGFSSRGSTQSYSMA